MRRRRTPTARLASLALAATAALAGLGLALPSTASAARPPRRALPAALAAGSADVAYAGSLLKLNEDIIGPAFTSATGIPYQGHGAGALGLAQQIKAGELTPNVFESVGAGPVALVEPTFTR